MQFSSRYPEDVLLLFSILCIFFIWSSGQMVEELKASDVHQPGSGRAALLMSTFLTWWYVEALPEASQQLKTQLVVVHQSTVASS